MTVKKTSCKSRSNQILERVLIARFTKIIFSVERASCLFLAIFTRGLKCCDRTSEIGEVGAPFRRSQVCCVDKRTLLMTGAHKKTGQYLQIWLII